MRPEAGARRAEWARTEEEPPLEDASASRLWETALGRLQLQLTRPNYDTWLKDTVGLRLEESRFVVGAPSDFATEWLNTRLRPLIGKVLTTLAGQALDVSFEVLGAPGSPSKPPSPSAAGQPLLSSLTGLDPVSTPPSPSTPSLSEAATAWPMPPPWPSPAPRRRLQPTPHLRCHRPRQDPSSARHSPGGDSLRPAHGLRLR